jgi:hypothetical protein
VADQLATPEQLASALQQDLDAATADVWLNAGTAVVQNAAGRQRIVEVEDDEAELIGTTESWLWLPQRPVSAVESVTLDGVELTAGTGDDEYDRYGARLWRTCGWAACSWKPSRVAIVYTHGYPTGDQGLEMARSSVLALAKSVYPNPTGATQIKIDDYAEVFSALAARMEVSTGLKAALKSQYGRRSGLVKVSG